MYSKHFSKKEFNYIKPEERLLNVLENLRNKTKNPIIITDSARTPLQHINIYKKLEVEGKLGRKTWQEAIPWGSRHLPAFGKNLRAVDIKCKKDNGYYKGEEIYKFLKEVQSELNINLGVGVGKNYCHVDIDRKKPTTWTYDY